MKHLTKTVVEFGRTVTLHRFVDDAGKGTLWHNNQERALAHYKRKGLS